MTLPSNALIGSLLYVSLLVPSVAAAQVTRYRFDLDTSQGFCDATTSETSCVRYDGDSAFFPTGSSFLMDVDFGAVVNNEAPVDFVNFWFPDVDLALGGTIVIEAPGEVSGSPPAGTWHLGTGMFNIDMGPVEFPNVLPQTVQEVDPFDAVSDVIPGQLQCLTPIPPMTGSPLNNGQMTIVARGCVTNVNETFFTILKGTLTLVPEPSGPLSAGAALLGLLGAARRFHGPGRASR